LFRFLVDELASTRNSTQFCPTCGNMLLLENMGEFRFYCQSCPYVQNIVRAISTGVQLKKKEVQSVRGVTQPLHTSSQAFPHLFCIY
jgi:DNA-directed RNA polymerase subunit M/transcription elongation factor TFIIS